MHTFDNNSLLGGSSRNSNSSCNLPRLLCCLFGVPMTYSMIATSLGGAMLHQAGWAVLSTPQLAGSGAVGGAVMVGTMLGGAAGGSGCSGSGCGSTNCTEGQMMACLPPILTVLTSLTAGAGADALGYTAAGQVNYAMAAGAAGGATLGTIVLCGGCLYYLCKSRNSYLGSEGSVEDTTRVQLVLTGINPDHIDVDTMVQQVQIQANNSGSISLREFKATIEAQAKNNGVDATALLSTINQNVKGFYIQPTASTATHSAVMK